MTKAIVLGGSRGIGKAISDSLKAIKMDVFATSQKDIDTSNLESVKEFLKMNYETDILVLNTGGPKPKPLALSLYQELITDHVNNNGRSSVMKLARARINPIPESEWTVAQRRYLEPIKGKAPFYNISATLARHIEAAEKFNVWAYHVMGDSSKLDGRHREILILRVGWLCDSEYEWGKHKIFAKNEGLSDEEIERIKIGSQADDWSDIERALLDAADELHENSFVSDQTWEALSKQYTEQQMMDSATLVFPSGFEASIRDVHRESWFSRTVFRSSQRSMCTRTCTTTPR